jgi:hypothetical protein
MRSLGHTFALILAILGVQSGVARGAHWSEASTWLTGAVAGVEALVIDRAGSTLYAETPFGGLFRSTDSGASWKGLGKIAGVAAVALDPTSAATIYAGTALRGVLKSTDGVKAGARLDCPACG